MNLFNEARLGKRRECLSFVLAVAAGNGNRWAQKPEGRRHGMEPVLKSECGEAGNIKR